MCKYGTVKELDHSNIINTRTGKHKIIKVDECIYDEIKYLNDMGVKTYASCCGHYKTQSECLIDILSVDLCKQLGYDIYEYSKEYTDDGIYKIYLKTGNQIKE